MVDPGTATLAAGVIKGADAIGQANAAGDAAAYQRMIANRAYQQQQRRFKTGQAQMTTGENQLMDATSAAPAELTAMRNDIVRNASAGQVQAAGQQNLANAQQGVRGSQAAILNGRQAGGLSKDLMSQLNDLAYQNAMTRQGQQANYFSQKALQGGSGALSV